MTTTNKTKIFLTLACCGLLVCVFLVKTGRRPRHSDTMEAAVQGGQEMEPVEIYNVPIPASHNDWAALEQKYSGVLPNYKFSHDEILALEHMYHRTLANYRITNEGQFLALEQRLRSMLSNYGVNECIWQGTEEMGEIDFKAIRERWHVNPYLRYGEMEIPTRAMAIIYLLYGSALPLYPYSVAWFCLGMEDDEYFYFSTPEKGSKINNFSHGCSVKKINGEIACW